MLAGSCQLTKMMKMIRAKQRNICLAILILGSIVIQGSLQNLGFIPLTSGGSGISSDFYSPLFLKDPVIFESDSESIKSELEFLSFIDSVKNDIQGVIRGVYSQDEFALPVVQQPAGQNGFVSTIDGVVTQFALPSKYGTTGLLAHNYLSGKHFYQLEIGDVVDIVYGDGSVRSYVIEDIQKYQALQPKSPSSSFQDLDTGAKLTATQLFKKVYMGSHHLTLQTCIQKGSEDSWGRMFIIANPI